MRFFDRLLYAVEETRNTAIQNHLKSAVASLEKDDWQSCRSSIEAAYNMANFCEKSDLARIHEMCCELIPKGDVSWES